MTLRSYGRATPCQMQMLCLAGGVFRRLDITTDASDEDRMESMRCARTILWRMTGIDFGYDLRRWHEYLQTRQGKEKDPYGYRHPYAWSIVRKAIERFIEDDDRRRLVALIQQRHPPPTGQEWEDLVELPPPPGLVPLRLPQHEDFTRPDTIACAHCGQPLRTRIAKQCFRCGADWH